MPASTGTEAKAATVQPAQPAATPGMPSTSATVVQGQQIKCVWRVWELDWSSCSCRQRSQAAGPIHVKFGGRTVRLFAPQGSSTLAGNVSNWQGCTRTVPNRGVAMQCISRKPWASTLPAGLVGWPCRRWLQFASGNRSLQRLGFQTAYSLGRVPCGVHSICGRLEFAGRLLC